jgi:hypothetical protein
MTEAVVAKLTTFNSGRLRLSELKPSYFPVQN